MIIGKGHRLQVPPWTADLDDGGFPSAPLSTYSSNVALQEAVAALNCYLPSNDHRYLPSNEQQQPEMDFDFESEAETESYGLCCDQFMMFEFKVRRCARGRSHDWTDCPYTHPNEKARRRDPRKYHYSGTACPDFRKGNCKKGDSCELAHGVFECWLHPARYRTQPCKDGSNCKRRICFFAHTPDQLRVLSQHSPRSVDSYDGSPLRQAIDAKSLPFLSTIGSGGSGSDSISPPASPMADYPFGSNSINEMVASFRNLQLCKMNSLPSSWRSGFGSPRGSPSSMIRPGFCSLPPTPTSYRNIWDNVEEEPPSMERVESGKCLRAKMFEKLSRENSVGVADTDPGQSSNGPNVDDVGWVSELVK